MNQNEFNEIISTIKDIRSEILSRSNEDTICHPRFDYRDFTDERLIYGMRITPIYNSGIHNDLENFNLGSCLTCDVIVPDYRFFKLKDMYEELCNVYDRCKIDFRKIPIKLSIGEIFRVLSRNSKYYRSLYHNNIGYRICIFIYNGLSDDLDKLAICFKNKDIEDAKILTNYFNCRLQETIKRISNPS